MAKDQRFEIVYSQGTDNCYGNLGRIKRLG